MQKQLIILISALILSFTTAQEKSAVDQAFIQENKKLCDGKNQSSAEDLLKTLVACQNIGRYSELLPLMYLGTDDNGSLLKDTSEVSPQDIPVGLKMGVDGMMAEIKLSEWRESMKESLQEQDNAYDEKTAMMMKLASIGEFEVEEGNLLPKSGKTIKGGNVKFTGVELGKENTAEINGELYFIQIDQKFYLFNLPL